MKSVHECFGLPVPPKVAADLASFDEWAATQTKAGDWYESTFTVDKDGQWTRHPPPKRTTPEEDAAWAAKSPDERKADVDAMMDEVNERTRAGFAAMLALAAKQHKALAR